MSKLVPCAGCARHVMVVDPTCPFCGAAIDPSTRVPGVATRRLGRAATFAFGAAIAASTGAAGCGETHDPAIDAGVDSGSIAQPYGLPPPDVGPPPPPADAGVDSGNVAPPYGLPPEDSGPEPEDAGVDGSIAQPYGLPPPDAGPPAPADAGMDAGNIAPPYGLPPRDGG